MKKLKFTIEYTVDADCADITNMLDHMRGDGSAEVVDVVVVDEEKEKGKKK